MNCIFRNSCFKNSCLSYKNLISDFFSKHVIKKLEIVYVRTDKSVFFFGIFLYYLFCFIKKCFPVQKPGKGIVSCKIFFFFQNVLIFRSVFQRYKVANKPLFFVHKFCKFAGKSFGAFINKKSFFFDMKTPGIFVNAVEPLQKVRFQKNVARSAGCSLKKSPGHSICKNALSFYIVADYCRTYIQGNLLHNNSGKFFWNGCNNKVNIIMQNQNVHG